jgi:hypothetical protein
VPATQDEEEAEEVIKKTTTLQSFPQYNCTENSFIQTETAQKRRLSCQPIQTTLGKQDSLPRKTSPPFHSIDAIKHGSA